MSVHILNQNAELLLQIAQNYNRLQTKKQSAKEGERERIEIEIERTKRQIRTVTSTIQKIIAQQKNV